MKIVFLGNHTVGVYTLKALLDCSNVELIGVIAHPIDDEDGNVYESVYDFSILNNLNVIRSNGNSSLTFNFINQLRPDLIWITDFRYIIPESVIQLSLFGAVNIHPSLLPKYRGRAAINWALINGEPEFGLTVHFVDNGVDTGDIIRQISIPIYETDYIEDLLNRSYPLYYSITYEVINMFLSNSINRVPQKELYPVFPKRTASDGRINWDFGKKQILNLIKAVSKPYPGAFTFINDCKLYVWKADIVNDQLIDDVPNGSIVSNCSTDQFIKIKCSDGYIKIVESEFDGANQFKINLGDRCT